MSLTTTEPIVIAERRREIADVPDWDRYEVIGQDGLAETETGHMLAVAGPAAWHGFGQVHADAKGMSVTQAMMKSGLLDVTIDKTPQMRDGLPIPGMFWLVRRETNEVLGGVGPQHMPVQPRDAFTFLEDITREDDLRIVSAGALAGRYERSIRSVFITARLPENIIVEGRDGHVDTIVPFIAAIETYDSSAAFTVITQPWRIECANTQRWGLRDAESTWKARHTANIGERMAEARRTLRLAHRYYDALAADVKALLDRPMTAGEIPAWIDQVLPPKDGAKGATLARENDRRDLIVELATTAPESAGARGTAYAAMCGLTDWLDHHRPVRPGKSTRLSELIRADSALLGDRDDVRSRARQLLLVGGGVEKR